ncbi:MAG TPA: hypothetical protein VF062_19640 [Candidatus Limnocylindrales bacterium]
MPDEPTLGELKRTMESGFASVNANLREKVSQDVYAADQRRMDDRVADLKVDHAEEKVERKAGDDKQQILLDKLATNLKWAFATILLPVMFFAADIYLSLRKQS